MDLAAMSVDEKISIIRSYDFWVRVCDDNSPVKYIVVDPNGDDEGWICAGGEEVLDLTFDQFEYPPPVQT